MKYYTILHRCFIIGRILKYYLLVDVNFAHILCVEPEVLEEVLSYSIVLVDLIHQTLNCIYFPLSVELLQQILNI